MAEAKKGMTKADIYKKLQTLKTDKGRYSYLNEISRKAGMLSPETKKAFYELLGDYALKGRRLNEAVEAYEKAGLGTGTKADMEKLADVYERVGKGRKAMLLREKIGLMKKGKKR